MKRLLLIALILTSCHRSTTTENLALIQIQDRNGLTETISNPDRLNQYQTVDFLTSQPYKKIVRVFKMEGKNHSKVTTYYPNGVVCQYLEAEEMRAHGAYREWYPNGQIKIDAYVIGGNADVSPEAQGTWLFEGVNLVYDEQGNRVATISYTKGQLNGPSIYYYPSGQIKTEIPFHKNDMEGDVVEYLENGTLKAKTHYKKGLKEEEALSFFENSALASVEDYSEGYLKTGIYYNPKGEKVSEIQNGGGYQALYQGKELTLVEFRVGQPDGLIRKFTSAGELQKSYHIKNGQKHGEEIDYYSGEKQTPKLSVSWNENRVHGPVKTWYPAGKLQSQREYSRNQRSGASLAWYPNGSLMLLEEYEEDPLETIRCEEAMALLKTLSVQSRRRIKLWLE